MGGGEAVEECEGVEEFGEGAALREDGRELGEAAAGEGREAAGVGVGEAPEDLAGGRAVGLPLPAQPLAQGALGGLGRGDALGPGDGEHRGDGRGPADPPAGGEGLGAARSGGLDRFGVGDTAGGQPVEQEFAAAVEGGAERV